MIFYYLEDNVKFQIFILLLNLKKCWSEPVLSGSLQKLEPDKTGLSFEPKYLTPIKKWEGLGAFWNISRTSHVSNEIPHDSFVPKLVTRLKEVIKEDGGGLSSPENPTIKQFGQWKGATTSYEPLVFVWHFSFMPKKKGNFWGSQIKWCFGKKSPIFDFFPHKKKEA